MAITQYSQLSPEVIQDLHPMCQACLSRHLVDKNLPFEVSCRPVKKDISDFDGLVDRYLAEGQSEEEALWSAYKLNIPRFAEDILDLPPHHPVQDDLYLCTAKRIVGRVHRRAGKTVAARVRAIHRCFFSDTNVLVVAPYEDQIEEFFGGENGGLDDIIMHAAKRNPWVLDWVVKPKGSKSGRLFRVKPRYKMAFITGAVIQGKVLRSTNTKRGSSARGLGVVGLRNVKNTMITDDEVAGMVIVDESDWLEPSDWATINPIIEQNASVESIEMSTPAGKREAYYDHCFVSPEHREIFYPITKRPDIAAMTPEDRKRKLELVRRSCQSEDEYVREWLAEPGLASSTIFRPEDLLACSSENWEYTFRALTNIQECPVMPKLEGGRMRMLGVDWNRPGIGVRIYVCEFFPGGEGGRGYYKMTDRIVVANVEFTQLTAADAIICANRLYRPHSIYVDAGFGDMQVEKLKQYGLLARKSLGPRHPDSQLPFIVKPINMQESLAIPDPAEPNNRKKDRKVSEKALMISFTQALTQERAVFFNRYERMEGNLISIMTSFKVERINPSGHPVYTGEKDHDVIASALALYAYWREFHYTKGRSILETAALISGRGLDEELPISAHLPKFKEGAVRRVRKGADDTTWSTMVERINTEEPDERHLIKLAENGKPVTSTGARRGGASGGGKGSFTSRTSGFSRRR